MRHACTCPFPIPGQDISVLPGTTSTRYIRRLLFPIRGKTRHTCTYPFPIQVQAISVSTSVISFTCAPCSVYICASGYSAFAPSLFWGKAIFSSFSQEMNVRWASNIPSRHSATRHGKERTGVERLRGTPLLRNIFFRRKTVYLLTQASRRSRVAQRG